MGNCWSLQSGSQVDDHPNARNHLGKPTFYTYEIKCDMFWPYASYCPFNC